MPSLFDPIRYGAIAAPNRVVMAPMTRGRATGDHVPTPLMIEYYRQRAAAGLIVTEGTGVSREGLGWPNAPGIWSDAQVEAWKPVTEAVHAAGGRIVTQLWHLGRLARQDVTGTRPLSSSATTAPARPGASDNPNVEARPMTRDDIARTHARRLRACRAQRGSRGLRRDRAARRQRLSDRPVHARRRERARRRLRRDGR